jgi:hypothetical protein
MQPRRISVGTDKTDPILGDQLHVSPRHERPGTKREARLKHFVVYWRRIVEFDETTFA